MVGEYELWIGIYPPAILKIVLWLVLELENTTTSDWLNRMLDNVWLVDWL